MKAKLLSKPYITLSADTDGGYCEFEFEGQDGSVGTAQIDFPHNAPELPKQGGTLTLEGTWLDAHSFQATVPA